MIVLAEEFRTSVDDPIKRLGMETELTQLLNALNHTLLSSERLHMLVALTDPWTIENGCLTPTLKIKRKSIEALVEDQLDGWYGAGAQLIWGRLTTISDTSPKATESVTGESCRT